MAVAGISRALLKSLISQGKKIRRAAMKLPLTQDYQLRRGPLRTGKEISERTHPVKYKSAIGEEKYNKFLKDFSKQYKTLGREDFQEFRKKMQGISPEFWLRTQQNALNKGFINRVDTKKVALRAGTELSTKVPSPLGQKQIKLKGDRRKAISSVYQDIAKEAPKNKAGLPILAKNAFGTKALFPRLKKQFPKLFEGMEDNLVGRKALRRVVESSPRKNATELTPFPSYLKKPDFIPLADTSNPTEVYLKNSLRNYVGEPMDRPSGSYFVDQWRSRGPEFRTGADATDVHNFLKFERAQGTLDPANPYYFKNNPEFKDYKAMRKRQVRGMELAHDRPTLNPLALYSGKHVPTETVPGSGADIGFTHFLERDVNRIWQPFYEDKAYKAMLANRYDELAAIDAEMIKRNIRTRIIDPNTGEERLMGGWKEFGYNQGGVVKGYAAGGLVGIGSKILAKLAKKLSEKELKMLMGSLWKGVDPKQAPHYKAWAKKRWGPGYKWPYEKSKIKGPKVTPSHMADLTPGERVELQTKHADKLWEFQMKKKLGRAMDEDLEYPFLNPENEAFIITEPRTGLGRYQTSHYVDPENVGPVEKYKVYDWWDEIMNRMRKKPKFKYVKDAKGNIILKEVK
jgi:hypothetical protein